MDGLVVDYDYLEGCFQASVRGAPMVRFMGDLDEHAMVLSIGSIVGGHTYANRGWIDGVRRLTRDVAEAVDRAGVDSNIRLNVDPQPR